MPGISDIVEALTGIQPSLIRTAGARLYEFREAVVDSRKAYPGTLFIAMPGESHDGHEFVLDAYKRGASLALVSQDISENLAQHGVDCLLIDLRKRGEEVVLPPDFEKMQGLRSSTLVCLLVDNTLETLQRFAEFWRNRMNLPRDRGDRVGRKIDHQGANR